ncbi:pantoate--beta-alanine ligase [Glycomyces sp. A-F 0318]|uniref:pantoate--beta-alanine ligase n=1 Tax=Glycomyces amatae TaxID=2881355 RepID=UPI001E361BBE|nr:pantoate--beta-alanine ligase [Glycomyces amatae]MCD0442206.1 pantoate--beta-alanine ligase [Glycomyces amatae]
MTPTPSAAPERPIRRVRLVHTKADLAKARAGLPGRVAVVPTMGALHDGHRANFRRAREAADAVVATVFVNPLQFRPNEDLDRYPRTLDADLAMCEEEGVDLVFAPSVAEMYPDGREGLTAVHAGPGGEILEGASRPGFFTGVLTVVAKLFHLTRPDAACFGEKDFQQLAMVRRMVRDLDMGVEVIGVPTVREGDGLARSSRNVFLSAAERAAALAIPRAIGAAQASPDPLAAARQTLEAEPGLAVDYVAVRANDLGEAPAQGPARLLIAAKAGTTRLIDNAPVVVGHTAIGDAR